MAENSKRPRRSDQEELIASLRQVVSDQADRIEDLEAAVPADKPSASKEKPE